MKDELLKVGKASGYYEMPSMKRPDRWVIEDLISFNFCLNRPKTERTVHFFIPDKEFVRVWYSPEKYVDILRRFNGCFSPDFSLYRDMPLAIQIYNTFRNRWCGRLWQEAGLNVVSSVAWSDERSYEFCFAGVERGSTVATSTRGAIREKVATDLFVRGYEAMIGAIEPEEVLIYGCRLEGLSGNVRWFDYDYLKTEALEKKAESLEPALEPKGIEPIPRPASTAAVSKVESIKELPSEATDIIPEGAYLLSTIENGSGMVVKIKYIHHGVIKQKTFAHPIHQSAVR